MSNDEWFSQFTDREHHAELRTDWKSAKNVKRWEAIAEWLAKEDISADIPSKLIAYDIRAMKEDSLRRNRERTYATPAPQPSPYVEALHRLNDRLR